MALLLRGPMIGLVATAAMTAVFLAGRLLHPGRKPPPARIVASAQQQTGIEEDTSEPAFQVKWLVLHFTYGSLLGLAYLLVRRWLPATRMKAGLAYGELLWGLDYLGVMPVLRLYPPPPEDSLSRTAVNIVAHGVYGVTLSQAERIFD